MYLKMCKNALIMVIEKSLKKVMKFNFENCVGTLSSIFLKDIKLGKENMMEGLCIASILTHSF